MINHVMVAWLSVGTGVFGWLAYSGRIENTREIWRAQGRSVPFLVEVGAASLIIAGWPWAVWCLAGGSRR